MAKCAGCFNCRGVSASTFTKRGRASTRKPVFNTQEEADAIEAEERAGDTDSVDGIGHEDISELTEELPGTETGMGGDEDSGTGSARLSPEEVPPKPGMLPSGHDYQIGREWIPHTDDPDEQARLERLFPNSRKPWDSPVTETRPAPVYNEDDTAPVPHTEDEEDTSNRGDEAESELEPINDYEVGDEIWAPYDPSNKWQDPANPDTYEENSERLDAEGREVWRVSGLQKDYDEESNAWQDEQEAKHYVDARPDREERAAVPEIGPSDEPDTRSEQDKWEPAIEEGRELGAELWNVTEDELTGLATSNETLFEEYDTELPVESEIVNPWDLKRAEFVGEMEQLQLELDANYAVDTDNPYQMQQDSIRNRGPNASRPGTPSKARARYELELELQAQDPDYGTGDLGAGEGLELAQGLAISGQIARNKDRQRAQWASQVIPLDEGEEALRSFDPNTGEIFDTPQDLLDRHWDSQRAAGIRQSREEVDEPFFRNAKQWNQDSDELFARAGDRWAQAPADPSSDFAELYQAEGERYARILDATFGIELSGSSMNADELLALDVRLATPSDTDLGPFPNSSLHHVQARPQLLSAILTFDDSPSDDILTLDYSQLMSDSDFETFAQEQANLADLGLAEFEEE